MRDAKRVLVSQSWAGCSSIHGRNRADGASCNGRLLCYGRDACFSSADKQTEGSTPDAVEERFKDQRRARK